MVRKLKKVGVREGCSTIKLRTDCIVRLCCTLLAMVMGSGGLVSILIWQPLARGLSLCIIAIVLMAMALGYRQIELICKTIRMRLRR
jgi:hypothetical protein